MKEKFPNKKKGDRLGASHINDLNEVAREVMGMGSGSYGYGHGRNKANRPPFMQQRMVVVAEEFDLGEAENDGEIEIYEVRRRYWDEDHKAWRTDDEMQPEFLDASDLDGDLNENDVVVAYWDNERQMWMPISAAGSSSSGNSAVECCTTPVDCKYMVIDKWYAKRYVMKNIPQAFGGNSSGEVILEHVGLMPTTNFYYWESDTFEIECDDGTDEYHWRMVVHADGTATNKHEGSEEVDIYIVRDSGSAVCGDLTAVNLTSACHGQLEEDTVSSSSSS